MNEKIKKIGRLCRSIERIQRGETCGTRNPDIEIGARESEIWRLIEDAAKEKNADRSELKEAECQEMRRRYNELAKEHKELHERCKQLAERIRELEGGAA